MFYEEALWGGVGLFNASNSVERDEWRAYVEALGLERYPGMSGIGFIQAVDKLELPQFIDNARITYPGFTRKTVGNLDEKEHYIILYIEPEAKNTLAIGLDIGSEKNRRDAATRSRNTGKAIITDPIVLVQDEKKTAGFLILLPVYTEATLPNTLYGRKRAFREWVYSPFIAENFLKDILHTNNFLNFRVRDVSQPDIVIYDTIVPGNDEAEFLFKTSIKLAGNTWMIEWQSNKSLDARFSKDNSAELALLLGILITLLLGTGASWLLLRDQKSRRKVLQVQSSLQESEDKFAEAFDNAAIGICLVSPDGGFLRVNESLCSMLGYSPKELCAKTFQDITYKEDLAVDEELIQKVLDNKIKTYTIQKRYITKDDQLVWIRLNVSLVRDIDQKPKFFVSQIEDITREKLLDDIKSNFISISSHQFRTPLSAIRWNLELLLDGIGKYSNKKISEILREVLQSSLRMNELVKDLLRVSKLESGLISAHLNPFELKKIVRDAIDITKPFALVKKQKIVFKRTSESFVANVDQGFLTEILQILLNNAVLYAPVKSTITVAFEPRKSFFFIHLENAGNPIPMKEQKKLFEKFSRLQHGVSSNPDGSGLGLFIARNLIELMHGDLKYDTKKKDCVRFTIKFPRCKS